MLHPIGKLRQHGVWNIAGTLRHKVYAHAPGTDQLHRLLHLLQQHSGRIAEQHVGLVKEEYHPGLVKIAALR